MSSLTDWINATPERRRDYEQERLIVDVAEAVQGLLNETGVKRADLARRMGTSRMSLHQMLSGQQNLTLRTMALMAHALGHRVTVKFEPYSEMETRPGHFENNQGGEFCKHCGKHYDRHDRGECPTANRGGSL